ncbi:MAG: HD domain-containing protein [Desulfotomaculum sp.]|nr:HD domain-containing protein [Desulfotomaculum sp.]
MLSSQLSVLLYDIVKAKMKVDPWEPLSKRISQSRLPNLNLDELHFKAVQTTAADYRMVELFPGPVIVVDEEGSIRMANESALAWMGKTIAEVENEFIGDLVYDRRRNNNKGQFLSPIIEVIVKKKETFLEKSYVSTALLANPIPVEISTKIIKEGNKIFFTVVIFNEFSAGNFDREILHMYNKIFSDNPEVLSYFAKYIAELDVYTRGHCQQVAEYALMLGMEVGLSNEELEQLYIVSMLHDIGKLAVSPEVLHKSGELTECEKKEMQIHPVAGADILEEFAVFYELAPYVRHHHENYDGTGYPGKLKGKEIPLLSRILSLADTFDIMTAFRPNSKTYTIEQVKEEFIKNSGKKYDPDLVDVAVWLIDSGKLKPANFCAVADIKRGKRESG